MSPDGFKRKLVAILSADVKGYSRLMGEDEEWTVRTLNAHKGVIRNLVGQHRGRVVDAPGDNVLAEFGSVVNAVQCAVEIQQVLRAKNVLLPDTRRMQFRIGINLGDVIEEEERIYGDGVNIAARLEGLADPGGICISGSAYEQIENKLPLHYDYLGEYEVKNIERPVRVYRALLEPMAPDRVEGVGGRVEGKGAGRKAQGVERKAPSAKRNAYKIGLGAVVVLIGFAALWHWVISPTPPAVEKADPKKMALPLPDKPSIAVLPFANMSGDAEQEYFSDGISEEIITALSKVPHVFVIARNSTFTYKGKAVTVKQVSEQLGVRYVLEGSVRKADDKVRITAQLIDALTGHHLWAERYDRHLKDIFALQDEITFKILTALQVKLTYGEVANLAAKGTKNLEAYINYMQALAHLTRHTKEGNATGRKFAEEAISLDPNYPRGYMALAQTHVLDILLGITDAPDQSLARAMELIKKAIALDDSEPDAHSILGYMYTLMGQYDKAIAEAERAASATPNSLGNLSRLSYVLINSGRPEEAISVLKNARRVSPIAPPFQAYFVNLTTAYRLTGKYKEAIETAKEAQQQVPNNIFIYLQLAATYIMMGREEEARSAAAEVLKIKQNFSLEWYAKTIYFKNQADRERTLDSLRRAGLK